VVGRQEHAVEREESWGIAKLRVDGGCAIEFSEAAAAAGVGAKRAGVCSLCDELFLACSIIKYLKC